MWTVRQDVTASELTKEPAEYSEVGVVGFNFNHKPIQEPNGQHCQINFLLLLQYLWPGNWKQQLMMLNRRISANNTKLLRQATKQVSENELWVFFGLMLAMQIEGQNGNLWDREDPEGIEHKVDMSEYMAQHCFNAIKPYILLLFANDSWKEHNAWWQFSAAVDLFNANRKAVIASRKYKVLDKSMSDYKPCTTCTGNLPHLSMIARKPEPLGTKFKTTVDCLTHIMLCIKLQKGKVAMADSKYSTKMLKTAACTCRLSKDCIREANVSKSVKDVFLGNSWFSSLPACINVSKNISCTTLVLSRPITHNTQKSTCSIQ